jgi:S1-C subfamily serine protease
MPDLPMKNPDSNQMFPDVDNPAPGAAAPVIPGPDPAGPGWAKPIAVGVVVALVAAGGWWLNRSELASLETAFEVASSRLNDALAASATTVGETALDTAPPTNPDTPEPDAVTRSDLQELDDNLEAAFDYLDDLALRQQDVERIVRQSPDFEAVRFLLEDSVVYIETEYANGSGFRVDVATGCEGSSDCRLYTAEGYDTMVITNYHVVEELSDLDYEDRIVIVYARDGSSTEGRLWDWDARNDLAAIDLNSSRLDVYLTPLPWTSPGTTAVGDAVAVGGHPFGLNFVMSTGQITAEERDGWQLDAIISQGNSGGPVVDVFGRVVGVATSTLGGLTYATDIENLCHRLLDC